MTTRSTQPEMPAPAEESAVFSEFHLDKALTTGKCKTRDGRLVFGLREAEIIELGRARRRILIGEMTVNKPPFRRRSVHTEGHYWTGNGFSVGDDDLDDLIDL
jgi:hypothetical protein